MINYIIRRLLLMIPTLIGISIVVFFLTQIVPGGPVDQMIARMKFGDGGAGQSGSAVITEEFRQQLNEYYGFDKPIPVRYLNWVKKFICLDFGESYSYNEPVQGLIAEKLPVSLTLGAWSFFLIYLISIPLGIAKAIKDGSHFDTVTSVVLFGIYAIPPFSLAILLIVFLAGGSFLGLFPLQGLHSDDAADLTRWGYLKDYLHHIVLPVVSYTLTMFAPLTLLMKNSFLNQLHHDYVTTARAKGLSAKSVYFKHVLRNAMIPVITGLGQHLGLFFGGSILIEQIFGLDGIGLLMYNSILSRDYPVALAIIMIIAFLSILGNFVADILYALVDPRIDFQKE